MYGDLSTYKIGYVALLMEMMATTERELDVPT